MLVETEILTAKASQEDATLDSMAKKLLSNKELVAPILQAVVSEVKDLSTEEIIECIDEASFRPFYLSESYPNVESLGTEFSGLEEKLVKMDVYFHIKNPKALDGDINVFLRINMEMQNDYTPGYSLEKRGVYYLARAISEQLSPVTDTTNYDQLEKVYSIWIINDKIPKAEQNTITHYRFTKEDVVGTSLESNKYDLMELILIRRGNEQNLSKGLFEYLEALLHGRLSKVKEYVDLDDNSERQVLDMKTLDQTMAEYYQNKGIAIGKEKGIIEGIALLFSKGFISLQEAAKEAHISEMELKKIADKL